MSLEKYKPYLSYYTEVDLKWDKDKKVYYNVNHVLQISSIMDSEK